MNGGKVAGALWIGAWGPRRVIGWSDHTAPMVQLIASREVGAVLVGAFGGENLLGFVHGFPGNIE